MEVLSTIKKNPFGETSGPELRIGSDPNDPLTWKSPFSQEPTAGKEEAVGLGAKASETAFGKAADSLAEDIRRADATLSGAKAAEYIRDAEEVRWGMKGLASLFKYYDDALSTIKIAKAESPEEELSHPVSILEERI